MMRYLILPLLLWSLSGCADVAMSGAQAVYNRKQIQKNINDQYSTLQAYQALNTNAFKGTNITVTTYDNDLLLAGQVPHMWQRMQAERLVKQETDVDHIYNALSISNPSSVLTRLSDTWITTKVKCKYLASDVLDASTIKVVTENGNVYLLGTLEPTSADEAYALAAETEGVVKVSKMFKYMRISRE